MEREFNEKIVALRSVNLLGPFCSNSSWTLSPLRRTKDGSSFAVPTYRPVAKWLWILDHQDCGTAMTPRRDPKWLEEIDCINVISDELLHELHRNKLQKQVHGASPETSTELASMNLKVTHKSRFVYVRVHRREGKKRLLGNDWMQRWKSRIEDNFFGDGQYMGRGKFCNGTAAEDQAVKNCHALYKVMGINVDRVWRSFIAKFDIGHAFQEAAR